MNEITALLIIIGILYLMYRVSVLNKKVSKPRLLEVDDIELILTTAENLDEEYNDYNDIDFILSSSNICDDTQFEELGNRRKHIYRLSKKAQLQDPPYPGLIYWDCRCQVVVKDVTLINCRKNGVYRYLIKAESKLCDEKVADRLIKILEEDGWYVEQEY